MKRNLLAVLAIFLFIFSSPVLASNEVVKAALSNTQTTDPSVLGWVHPCDKVRFIVTYTIPANYNRVQKYEWYLNNVLVYTGTDPNTPAADITMTAGNGPTVTCKVTYINDGTGVVTGPFTSTGFSVQVRPVGLNPITQTGGTLALGCPSPVSFSTSVVSGNDLFYTPPATDYVIKWTLPANWSFSSGNTGNTITANPDGFTTGNVAAYLQMNACPYTTNPLTFPISYTTPSPALSSSNPTLACGSSQSYSINAMCGAVSYTFTINGNAGCVFAANGLQTLTTAATSVSVNFPATGGNFYLVASANYSNNTSSAAVSGFYSFGVAHMTLVINKWTGYTFFALATNIPGANYTWTLDSHSFSGDLGFYDEDITCGVTHHLSVYATTACGTTNTATLTMNKPCGGGGPAIKVNVSPNPVQGVMRVSLAIEEGQASPAGKVKLVKAARIVDKAGRIVRRYEFGTGLPEASLNTSGLATDIYILQIFDGVQWVHREIIVK